MKDLGLLAVFTAPEAQFGVFTDELTGLAGLVPVACFVKHLGASRPDGRPDDTESQARSRNGLTPIMCPEQEIRLHAIGEKERASETDRTEGLDSRPHSLARTAHDQRSRANLANGSFRRS